MTTSTSHSQLVVVRRWLQVLEDEYLREFVPSGGSAVKFVSGRVGELSSVAEELQRLAGTHGLCYVFLDPARLTPEGKKPDLHRIERFLFSLTRAVEWRAIAAEQARRHLEEQGLRVRPERALNDLDGIAEDNGCSRDELLARFQRQLTQHQIRDRGMGVEFRSAIAALVHSQILPEHITPTTEEVLVGWLTGITMRGGARTLKRVQVYERISAANAWAMLRSFAHWLPKTGQRGLMAVLDFRPYEVVQVPPSSMHRDVYYAVKQAIEAGASREDIESIYQQQGVRPAVHYSQKAYLNMLSLLRHLIDADGEIERSLFVVLANPDYFSAPSIGRTCRTYHDYDALQTRVGLEVHDARHPNPSAALVHLGGAP